ncbi:hypothetical protein Tco_0353306 [Tanacetum coccineum]
MEKELHRNSQEYKVLRSTTSKEVKPKALSFSVIEKILNALSQVNNVEAIKKSVQANVVKEFKNQVPKLLLKAISDAIKKNLVNLSQSTPTPTIDPTKYELTHQLYERMFQTTTYLKHNKHHALYDSLQESMQVDKLQRQKGAGESSFKKVKAQDDSPHYERGDDAEEPRQEEELEHRVQSELVDAEDELEEHKLLNGLVVLFGKCMKKFLNKGKITKEDLEGPAFELLKKRFKNNVELEYNMELCHLALTYKIDWANPEGNRFHDDLSKQLPLVGPLMWSLSVGLDGNNNGDLIEF